MMRAAFGALVQPAFSEHAQGGGLAGVVGE